MPEPIKPKCPKCGRTDLRFRIDKTFRCLKCGYDSRDKEMR